MTKCAVKKCFNNNQKTRKNDGVYFFRFPQNRLRRAEWTAIIARDRRDPAFKPHRTGIVCSAHFPVAEIYTTKKGFNRLTPTAKPSLNMSEVAQEDIESQSFDTIFVDSAEISQTSSVATGSFIHPEVSMKSPTPSELTSSSFGSVFDSPAKNMLKDEIRMCRKKIEDKNKTIQNLKKQNRRLKKKILSLKNTVSILKTRENCYVSEHMEPIIIMDS